MPNAIVVEKNIVGIYGTFITPETTFNIKYDNNQLRNLDWDLNAMIGDNWCSSYTPVLSVTQPPTLAWNCTLGWGGGPLSIKFE